MKTVRLKKGADQRLRSRHPWVFSNELSDSPKSISPGEIIEIHDHKGHFIARGYGNPHSLIAFRALSYELKDSQINSIDFMTSKLYTAWEKRVLLGFNGSYRICFSEADQLPGLIIDRYLIKSEKGFFQVLSFQLLTFGMDKIFNQGLEIFKSLVDKVFDQKIINIHFENTILLKRNDVNIRKLEGLEVQAPEVIHNSSNINLKEIDILIASVANGSATEVKSSSELNHYLSFSVNLIEGQKTGFFLDQTHNIRLVIQALTGIIQRKKYTKDNPLRLLDLCCYMGQWAAQVAYFLKSQNVPFEVLLVDVSEMALKQALLNLNKISDQVSILKADVLKELTQLPDRYFDVVISDPPAFVKNKKDLDAGLHGYMKLNEQAFRVAKSQGLVASCTCSGLVEINDFKQSVRKSILRSGHKAQLITEGGLGWDHPTLIQFPEGQYLKMLLHLT